MLYPHLEIMQLLRKVVAFGRKSSLQKHAFRILVSPHSSSPSRSLLLFPLSTHVWAHIRSAEYCGSRWIERVAALVVVILPWKLHVERRRTRVRLGPSGGFVQVMAPLNTAGT